jgi:hypothetical protein
MKLAAKIVSWAALLSVVGLAGGYFADVWPLEKVKAGLLVATVLWFVTVPFWMEHRVV